MVGIVMLNWPEPPTAMPAASHLQLAPIGPIDVFHWLRGMLEDQGIAVELAEIERLASLIIEGAGPRGVGWTSRLKMTARAVVDKLLSDRQGQRADRGPSAIA
jgi:hypothetical protein